RKGWARVSTFISVTSAPVNTGLATSDSGCNASGDSPAYTPSVHTLFFSAACGLGCGSELPTIEAEIAHAKVQTPSTLRAHIISALLFTRDLPQDIHFGSAGADYYTPNCIGWRRQRTSRLRSSPRLHTTQGTRRTHVTGHPECPESRFRPRSSRM